MTKKEQKLLQEIKDETKAALENNDNIAFDRKLTNEEKGIISSLVKKGLVYDSFDGEFTDTDKGRQYYRHNYFSID